jgi:hypothetical protein
MSLTDIIFLYIDVLYVSEFLSIVSTIDIIDK